MNWQKYKETAHCGSIGIGLLDGQYVCTMLRGSKIFFITSDKKHTTPLNNGIRIKQLYKG